MPSTSTITGYNVFSSGTLIRSAAVNTNFSVYRGHLIAVDPDTATLSDLTYDLGSTGYRWKRAHVQEYVFSHHSTPSAPIAGQVKVYFKSDGNPYYLNASGTEAGFGGFASPLTTKGDLHGYTSTGDARVPVGTNGHVLTADSSATAGVSWKVASVTLAITTVTGTYTATGNEDVILADSSNGAYTIYLATATGNSGKQCIVKKITTDFNAVSLDGISTETVDDTTVSSVNTFNEALHLFAHGNNWVRKSREIPVSGGSYTPTITGMGTVTEVDFSWERRRDSLKVWGSFKAGGATTTQATITLPNAAAVNSSKIGTTRSTKILGHVVGNVSTTPSTIYSAVHFIVTYDSTYIANGVVIADATDSDAIATGTIFRPDNGSSIHGGANRHMTMVFEIPISGWKG